MNFSCIFIVSAEDSQNNKADIWTLNSYISMGRIFFKENIILSLTSIKNGAFDVPLNSSLAMNYCGNPSMVITMIACFRTFLFLGNFLIYHSLQFCPGKSASLLCGLWKPERLCKLLVYIR